MSDSDVGPPTEPLDLIVDAPRVGDRASASRGVAGADPSGELDEFGAIDETGDVGPGGPDDTARRRRRDKNALYDEHGNPRPIVVATPLAPGFRGVVHPKWVERLFTTHDIYGPRVRLGVLWFVLQVAAIRLGGDALAWLFGSVATIAALQVCREWRKVYSQPNRLVAALGAGGIAAASTWGAGAAGLAVVATSGAALLAALFRRRRTWSPPLLDAASCTIRAGVFPGAAAASVVLTYRASVAGALILLGLVAAYELGDFLMGAESPGVLIGPFFGIVSVVAATFPIAVFNISPFDHPSDAAVFGGAVAVFAPLSQVAGSLILPVARSWSPALRRIDTLLLTGPVWLLLLWSYLG